MSQTTDEFEVLLDELEDEEDLAFYANQEAFDKACRLSN
jgi:hypothetical protein